MWSMLPGTLLATVLGSVLFVVSRWTGGGQKKITQHGKIDRKRQAIQQKNARNVYRSGMVVDSEEPIAQCLPEVSTLYEAFMRGLEVSNNGQCLGYRPGKKQPYHFLTYTDVFRHARDFGSAIVGKLGLKPGNDTHVGVYAKNCPEWFMSAFGCVQHSIVVVPLYDTLGADAATFIIQQTEMKLIVVDNADKAKKLLSRDDLPTLEHIIVIENADTAELRTVNPNVQVHTFQEIIREGQQNPVAMTLPKPDDTYIICYTSGTTGVPKGVMLTHKNVVANVSGFYMLLKNFSPENLTSKAVLISYLPLSHMMEQMCHWCACVMGASVGYFSGNIQHLTDDMKELKPTIFPVVPRLLNRFYDLIQANVQNANAVSRAVFHLAYQRKLALLKQGIARNDTIWDKLVFSKIQAQTGGRVSFMATGSAPLSAEVLETCRVALGATIVEAYGQTECTAMATSTWPGESEGGQCGGPSTCTLIKLADVPDLNYFASEGKGEIMIKGPHVTKGYFKDAEKTAELFDEDGFLHTGDVGQMLPNGCIKIIDRKKHIFKLAQGEYVAPEKIENVYVRAPCVQQVYVDGDSLERFLVAVVVPEESVVKKWFHDNVENNGKSYKEMLCTKEVQKFILSELQQIGKENKLNSIEQVKAVHVTSEVFSVENGLLTPTLKAKRPQLRKVYADVMADLYKNTK